MVRIFYLSREFPSADNPMKDIFISQRRRVLKAHGHECDMYFLIMKYGAVNKFFQRLFGHDVMKPLDLDITKDGITWVGITYPYGLKEAVQQRINRASFKKHICEKIADIIISKIDFSNYDLIHCHVPYLEGYVGAVLSRKTGLPLIITCHGSDIHTAPHMDPEVKDLTVSAISQANRVIFVSKYLLKAANDLGYSGDNAVVIPNGVDTDIFKIGDRETNKRKHGLSGKVVGYVGNLIAVKRADAFPEIFRKIHEKRKDVEFLIVGDGSLRRSLIEKTGKLGLKVKFIGAVAPSEVPEYMNAMDVLILPSRNEGWGCVIVEAQACGVPVIGSGNGGIPEAIGEGGVIVSEGEDFEERFAKAAADALNRDWDRNALRGMALKMDWTITVKREIDVYSSLIKQ